MGMHEANSGFSDKVTELLMVELRRERRLKYFRTFVMIAIFSLFFFSGMISGYKSRSMSQWTYGTYWVSGKEPAASQLATIAVIRINGIISGDILGKEITDSGFFGQTVNTVAQTRNLLIEIGKEQKEGQNIAALILYVDSPGGTVSASDEIFKLVRTWKRKRGIRVIAYFASVAASGGYYIAQSADEIIANEHTLTGSIGVILSSFNFSGPMKRFEVEVDTVKSGKYKDIGSPFRKMLPDERKIFQDLINESFASFITTIEEGRGGRMSREEILKVADGRIYTGRQAKTAKLVDDIADFETLISWETNRIVKENPRYGGAKVVVYHSSSSLFGNFFSALRTAYQPIFLPGNAGNIGGKVEPMYLWISGM